MNAPLVTSSLSAASGEGLYGGARAVSRGARAGQLRGVVGTVAEVIEAPAELETAIEVALGGRVQDVVVERLAPPAGLPAWVGGATILPDGAPALILDPAALF